MDIQIILLVLILVIVLIFAFLRVKAMYSTVIKKKPPFVPSQKQVFYEVAQDIRQRQSEKGLNFFEVGCGIGSGMRIIEKLLDVKTQGAEVGRGLCVLGTLLQKITGSKGKILNIDVMEYDFSTTDIVYVYMFPSFVERLEVKLQQELKEGALIYSYAFEFSLFTKIHTIPVKGALHKEIYVYQK